MAYRKNHGEWRIYWSGEEDLSKAERWYSKLVKKPEITHVALFHKMADGRNVLLRISGEHSDAPTVICEFPSPPTFRVEE